MNRPPVACSHPRCRGYATNKGWCDEHQPKTRKSTNRAKLDRDRFYDGGAWRKLRRSVLMAEPLCRHCMDYGVLTEAACVDHIVPRVDGGADLEWSNLQPLCWSCHSKKTNEENKG